MEIQGAEGLGLGQFIDPEIVMHAHWQNSGDRDESVPDSDDEEDDESESVAGSEESEVRIEDSDGEDSENEPDIFDWDSFKAPGEGLSALDQLGTEYEREAAAIAD
ncbi:hypothetical protein B0H11DRAFT_1922815 [Mycena galericulata]|nr:hypothetical protein B0H11DRAFT_1922815 [Mycena galericulata]